MIQSLTPARQMFTVIFGTEKLAKRLYSIAPVGPKLHVLNWPSQQQQLDAPKYFLSIQVHENEHRGPLRVNYYTFADFDWLNIVITWYEADQYLDWGDLISSGIGTVVMLKMFCMIGPPPHVRMLRYRFGRFSFFLLHHHDTRRHKNDLA